MSDVEVRINLIKKIIDEKRKYVLLNYSKGKALLVVHPLDKEEKKMSLTNTIIASFIKKSLSEEAVYKVLTKDIPEDEIDNPNQNRLLLEKKETIQASINLMKEADYCYFALRLLENVGEEFLEDFREQLWEHENILSVKILLKLLVIEGRESKALIILSKMKENYKLTSLEEERFAELSLKYKIEGEFQNLQQKFQSVGMDELQIHLDSLKTDFDERIKLSTSIAERKYNEIMKRIQESDLLITDERKEGLQKQIDITNQRITGVQNSMRTWVAILAIVFGLVSTVSLIFVGLLSTGVLPP